MLSGLTVLVVHRLALKLFHSAESAGLAVLFTVASPVFFADGISYYLMTAHLLFNGVFALLLLEPAPRRLVLAGVVGSFALSLHNPVPHVLFAAPWIVSMAPEKGSSKSGMAGRGLPAFVSAPGRGLVLVLLASHQEGAAAVRDITAAKVEQRVRPTLLDRLPVGAGHRAREGLVVGCAGAPDPRPASVAGSGVTMSTAAPRGVRPRHLRWLSLRAARSGSRLGLPLLPLGMAACALLGAAALAPPRAVENRDRAGADGDMHSFVVASALLMLVVGVGAGRSARSATS